MRDSLHLTLPILGREVKDWEAAEKLWWHIMHKELRVQPEEYNVMLTEAALSTTESRQKTAQVSSELQEALIHVNMWHKLS